MKTDVIHLRIDKDIMDFIRKQANKNGHTNAGMINHFLRNEKNRTENRERKEKE